jgi:O-acetyl-ADP-ribose deacetylase (regulator of RNase III)
MAIIHQTGDLFSAETPALMHGVNTKGLMGAGIAVRFREDFPEMYEEYRRICKAGELLPGDTFIYDAGEVVVYNAASQDKPGPDARLPWLISSVSVALADADERGFEFIAMPLIGCGIGGLVWEDVEPELEKLTEQYGVDLEVWTYKP